MSIILIGTDPFLALLSLAINESLRQRIHCYCRLAPFSAGETAAYITSNKAAPIKTSLWQKPSTSCTNFQAGCPASSTPSP